MNAVNQEYIGHEMHELAQALYPICRSITGDGVRATLRRLQGVGVPLQIHEVPTGTKCFDWTIPDEWNIRGAWIKDPDGKTVVDFAQHNLHVVNYSEPVHRRLSLDELDEHIHTRPDLPDAIPYVTSYYKPRWGFCMSQNQRDQMKPGQYEVMIDADLKPGSLTYGELVIPGQEKKEVLISSYVCHPSMANNELSGPILATYLAKWLSEQPRRYTYRIVLVPETIGAIAYLSQNDYVELRDRTIAGFVTTCVGDERGYSYMPSRLGNTLPDRLCKHILSYETDGFTGYSFLDRGSDERQYCSPGIDLPVVSMMRSKYGTYPEYHTSLDDLSLVTPKGLAGAFEVHRKAIELLEQNRRYRAAFPCEPMLSKHGLRSSLGGKLLPEDSLLTSHFLAYCDGTLDMIGMGEALQVSGLKLVKIAGVLKEKGVDPRKLAFDVFYGELAPMTTGECFDRAP